MDDQAITEEFDAIVVGTGPSGATVARELSRRGKKVLILERGADRRPRDGFQGFDMVKVNDRMIMPRGVTTGGTSAMYFAVAEWPPLDSFRSLGIDLSQPLEEARQELPLGTLPDQLIGPQAMRVRDSAVGLGLPWEKRTMLVDQSKCAAGYAHEAKWSARCYLRDAVNHGAKLVSRAQVTRVLVENSRSIGVEYRLQTGRRKFRSCRAYGAKVVLAAGALATPIILRDSGIGNVVNRGFYYHPSCAVFGLVPGLRARDNFVACMGADLEDDIALGDANASRALHRLIMLGEGQLRRIFQHSRSVGVAVVVKDRPGGTLGEDGRYHKPLTREESDKLHRGAAAARRIVENAGGNSIYRSAFVAAHFGGVIRIQEHVDRDLQTEFSNLHVCDGSVIPEDFRLPPTLTLVCLGKYLAGRLVASG